MSSAVLARYLKTPGPICLFPLHTALMNENPEPTSTPISDETSIKEAGAEADLGRRIAAAVIDFLIAMALAWTAGLLISRLAYPVWFAYMLTRDSLPFLDGQSLGKKTLNLRAVTEGGNSLSGDWNAGLIRNVPMIIPFGALVELVVMLVNKEKPGGIRRLGDQWAKTKVVALNG